MNNLKRSLGLIVVGMTIGAIIVLILKPDAVQVGPFQFDVSPAKGTTACPTSAVIVSESLVDVWAFKYPWNDTDIEVQKGDCLEFTATRTWWSGISLTGPDGDDGIIFGLGRPDCGQCPVTDGNLGELVGKVGDGVPFRIGSSTTLDVDRDGYIMLAMNENTGKCDFVRNGSCYDDNKDALKVKVTVRRIK